MDTKTVSADLSARPMQQPPAPRARDSQNAPVAAQGADDTYEQVLAFVPQSLEPEDVKLIQALAFARGVRQEAQANHEAACARIGRPVPFNSKAADDAYAAACAVGARIDALAAQDMRRAYALYAMLTDRGQTPEGWHWFAQNGAAVAVNNAHGRPMKLTLAGPYADCDPSLLPIRQA